MRKVYLERPKAAGGLGIPIFLHYYWSANISKCVCWVCTFGKKGLVDPKCLRCHQSPATPGDMFWSCQYLSGFWDHIC